MRKFIAVIVLLVILAGIPTPARADVAPPAYPPGSNPEPGSEATQVRMMAEIVRIEVLPGDLNQARVTADFTMRNLGNGLESMSARFPLSSNDGFGRFPEIRNLNVRVDGRTVSTRRITSLDPLWGFDPSPWAEFDVTFPPGQDVQIRVTYTLDGTGEYPFISFSYILHTGAGWQGTIGSADLIVQLPYETSAQNVIFEEHTGWSSTTPGGVINGNEIRWRFEDFEPTREDNFVISLVMPSAWQKVLRERANVGSNPNDGEAWGRLGKLYKEIFFFRRGFRHDLGGREVHQLSIEAYEKCLALLPDDAVWHAGFADLLATHAYYASQEGENALPEMLRSMEEIRLALDLAPNDPKVREIAEKIYFFFPNAIQQLESGYDFLWLTATPVLSSPMPVPAEPTETRPAPPATSFTATAVPEPEARSTPAPAGGNPLCGSAVMIPLLLLMWARRRRNPLL